MAITILQQPQAYMPAYNNQYFVASSNQVAQPNFTYTIVITDLISGNSITEQYQPRPDQKLVFDAGIFSENQIRKSNYIPINIYGWQIATGVRKIRVNIGETYGSTPVYTAGSNIDYVIWNGVLDYLEQPGYLANQFVYTTSPINRKYFAGVLNDLTFRDRSNYLYALTSQAGDLPGIRIKTYNASGLFLANSDIANPFSSSSVYTNKYNCIDVGYKGLQNIPAGQVTGAYPIITSQVDYYEIYDNVATPVLIKKIRIGCGSRFKVMTVHYLAKNGAFLTLNFDKISEASIDKQSSTYMQNPNALSAANVYGYNYYDSPEHQLSITTQTTLKLRTDWLTDEQVLQYRECFDSPMCYLDLGASQSYAVIKPVTNSYKSLPRYGDPLTQLEMDFQYTHQNFRQRL